jgi:alkylhydroperoxidase family enzyme
VILRVAYNCRSRYEWIQHRALARVAGVDEGSLDRVALGPQAEGWTPRQQAMLAAADELHRDRVIGPDTWQTLREHLAPPSLIELCALVGHYEMTAMTLNSLGVQVEPPALALERRASVPSGLVWRRIARRRLGKERACSPSAA